MTQQVLALKWRPRTFNEVIGQPHVVQALSNGLDNNRLHHAFLFTGTRGVGKTTLARIFAKSLNCEKGVTSTPCGVCSICREVDEGRFVDLIEIDAASRTRVEDTREILDNVQYAPTRGRYKIYLIDEVHMLSNSSFNALLKTLEEPPSHVKFLLATTDPQKLPVTVLSRCLRFQLKRINDQEIAGQLEKILTAENIPFEPEALKLIAKAGDGSMRDALSLLDQAIAYGGQQVQYSATHEMLGLIDTQYLTRVLTALATKESGAVIATLNNLKANGLDYYRFLEDLIDAFHLLTMIQLSPEFASTESDDWVGIAELFSAEDLQLFYQVALNGRKDLQNHPNSEVGFEMTLLRMVLFAPHAPVGVQAQKKNSINIETNAASSEILVENRLQSQNLLSDDINPIVLPPADLERSHNDQETAENVSIAKVNLPWEDLPKSHNDRDTNTVVKNDDTVNIAPDNFVENLNLSSDSTQINDVIKAEDKADNVDFVVEEVNSRAQVDPVSLSHDNITHLNSPSSVSVTEEDKSTFNETDVVLEGDLPEEPLYELSTLEASLNREAEVDGGQLSSDVKNPDIALTSLVDNEAWLSLVSSLSLESVLSGIAHSLVFKSFNGQHLIVERPLSVQAFRVDEAEVRLAMAISNKLNADITCKIEYVEHLDVENLHERTERLDEERLQKALDDFRQDPVIQYLKSEFQAVLLDKTLKPID